MKTRLEEVKELTAQARDKMDTILAKRQYAMTHEEKAHSKLLYQEALEEYVKWRLELAKLENA